MSDAGTVKTLYTLSGEVGHLAIGSGANGSAVTFYIRQFSPTTKNYAVVDISGWTLKLTVTDEPGGTAISGATFPLTGTVSDGPNGVVAFDFSGVNFTTPQQDVCVSIYRVTSSQNRYLGLNLRTNIIKFST